MSFFTFEEVAEIPVAVRIRQADGTSREFSFPRLGVRGLIPWLADLTAARRAAGRTALVKMQLQPIDKWRAEKAIEMDEAIIGDLAGPVQTPGGVEKVIRLSLASSDVPVEQRDAVLKTILTTAHLAANLAQELSTLFVSQAAPLAPTDPATPVLGQGKGGGSPLGSPASATPSSSGDGSEATGSPTDSSSNATGPTETP
jgi:hypothetical protein